MSTIPPIPQWYDGIKFRSTLEARWAVFFHAAQIRWHYEPEGFVIGGTPYRPDFLLPDSGTWIEVKGDPGQLDLDLMCDAAAELPQPQPKYEHGPPILLLGHMPAPPAGQQDGEAGDWGWIGLHADEHDEEAEIFADYYGFGNYQKNLRPWWLDEANPTATGIMFAIGKAQEYSLTPVFHPNEPGIPSAYAEARAYRFGRR